MFVEVNLNPTTKENQQS